MALDLIPESGFSAATTPGLTLATATTVTSVFQSESAGFRSAIGMYLINPDGTLGGVTMLFANASAKGSGGDLAAGAAGGSATLKAGQSIGFFIASDAYGQNPNKFLDSATSFQLVNSKGQTASLKDGADVQLVTVDKKGKAEIVKTAYGSSLFFSNSAQNVDKMSHVKLAADAKSGFLTLSFEDLLGGGDRDFNDAVIKVNVGSANLAPAPVIPVVETPKPPVVTTPVVQTPVVETPKPPAVETPVVQTPAAETPAPAAEQSPAPAASPAPVAETPAPAAEQPPAPAVSPTPVVEDPAPVAGQAPVPPAGTPAPVAEQAPAPAEPAAATPPVAASPEPPAVIDLPAYPFEAPPAPVASAPEPASGPVVDLPPYPFVPVGATQQPTEPAPTEPAPAPAPAVDPAPVVLQPPVVPVSEPAPATTPLEPAPTEPVHAPTPVVEPTPVSVPPAPEPVVVEAPVVPAVEPAPVTNPASPPAAEPAPAPAPVVADPAPATAPAPSNVIYGTTNGERLAGVVDNVTIYAKGGQDLVIGTQGHDNLFGGSGDDLVIAGSGNDTISGNSGNDTIYGQDGNDLINGNSGNDLIYDGAGDDSVYGGSGDDWITVGTGRDYYAGNDGFDTLDFSQAAFGVTMDISKKSATVGADAKTFETFESYVGSIFADSLRGSKAAEVINGGGGDDWIRSLGGADTLTGGEGKDVFAYSPKDVFDLGAHLGVDRITDFAWQEDKLDLYEITKNFKGDKYLQVKLEQAGDGTLVSANLGTSGWQQVVILEHASTAMLSAAMKDWLIV